MNKEASEVIICIAIKMFFFLMQALSRSNISYEHSPMLKDFRLFPFITAIILKQDLIITQADLPLDPPASAS